MDTLNVGDRVVFGRSHGEQTMGTVLKVNRTTVQVRQDEVRGTLRDYPVGTKWKVPFKFVRKVGAALSPSRQTREIVLDILGCYIVLTPEGLACDGELRGSVLARREATIRARLKVLFVELGREVTEFEAYRMLKSFKNPPDPSDTFDPLASLFQR